MRDGKVMCQGAGIPVLSGLSSSGTENQIEMREIKRRKSNLIEYIWGIRIDMAIPKTVRQNEA